MKVYEVELKLIEPMLGTAPLNKELYSDWIASRAPVEQNTDDELLSVAESLEKGTTGFHRLDGNPAIYDYMIRGAFKNAASVLKKVPGTMTSRETAYKKLITNYLFVYPRIIPIVMPEGAAISILERPLRASTPRGEITALTRSETVPTGSIISFEVKTLALITKELLEEWLGYLQFQGLGQWRNASYGRCQYVLKLTDRTS